MSAMRPPDRRSLHAGVLLGAFLFALVPLAAGAATYQVDTTDDDPAKIACDDATPNDCSLRGAITASNGAPSDEGNTIVVPAGNYVLSQSGTCTYSRFDFGPYT